MTFDYACSIREKSAEYTKYINDHISNVSKAFNQYGAEICRILDVDYDDLSNHIVSHDASKYGEKEFSAYRRNFYPAIEEGKDDRAMDLAWHHHIINNPHHWNHYVITDEEGTRALDMPDIYIAEMILDWIAMSYKFKSSTKSFFKEHGPKMLLKFDTRQKINMVLDLIKESENV